jgi:uncharacterized protein YecA (UPF0149 family)
MVAALACTCHVQATPKTQKKIGVNDPCHCGSGKKYKKCHMLQDAKK